MKQLGHTLGCSRLIQTLLTICSVSPKPSICGPSARNNITFARDRVVEQQYEASVRRAAVSFAADLPVLSPQERRSLRSPARTNFFVSGRRPTGKACQPCQRSCPSRTTHHFDARSRVAVEKQLYELVSVNPSTSGLDWRCSIPLILV